MSQEKLNQQTQARDLYFGAEHTQKQIADKVGVSERTVYGWIKHNSWAQLREAAFAAPAIINQNISNHIIALQNVISARPIEERYPTKDESQIISRMLLCMDRLKKFPSLSQNLHMMQNFINTFVGRDMETAEKVTTYADQYFRSKTQNSFDPWQMEYQMEEKQYQTFTKNEAAKAAQQEEQNVDNQDNYAENTTGSEPACPPIRQEVSRKSSELAGSSIDGSLQGRGNLATGTKPACPPWREVSRNSEEAKVSHTSEGVGHLTPDSDMKPTRSKPEVSRNFDTPEPFPEFIPPVRLDSDILTEEIRYTNGIPWKYYLKNGEVHDIAYAYDGQDEELHLLQLHLEREGHYGIDESSDPANPIINSLCGVEDGRYRKCKTQNGEIVELGDFIPDEVIKAIDHPGKRIWLSQLKRAS